MRLLVGTDIGNYKFNPGVANIGNIVFTGMPSEFSQEHIKIATNVNSTGTEEKIIYQTQTKGKGGSLNTTTDTLTLEYDTSIMSSTDILEIIVEMVIKPEDQFPQTVFPFYTGQQPLSQAQPVALANEQFFDFQIPLQNFTNSAINTNILFQDCLQYRQAAIQINTTSGISAGIITFEGSNDSANWVAISVLDLSSTTMIANTTLTLAASTSKYFIAPLNLRYLRVRVSTAIAGGSISISTIFRIPPFAPPINVVTNTPINQVQYGGQPVVTGGLNGVPSVGGNIATGVAATANPVPIGGVDALNLTRRIQTDTLGQIIVVGADQSRTANANPNPVLIKPISGNLQPPELLESILYEIQLTNMYLKNLPEALNAGISFNFDINDIINTVTDKI